MPLEVWYKFFFNKFRYYFKGVGFFSEIWDGEALVIFNTVSERGGEGLVYVILLPFFPQLYFEVET